LLLLFAAAIGAVQIGLVASQKIPQYFDGTDNHTGGLMLVNDGKGANYQEKVICQMVRKLYTKGRNV
jgi:ribose 5-phosphate isomerase